MSSYPSDTLRSSKALLEATQSTKLFKKLQPATMTTTTTTSFQQSHRHIINPVALPTDHSTEETVVDPTTPEAAPSIQINSETQEIDAIL